MKIICLPTPPSRKFQKDRVLPFAEISKGPSAHLRGNFRRTECSSSRKFQRDRVLRKFKRDLVLPFEENFRVPECCPSPSHDYYADFYAIKIAVNIAVVTIRAFQSIAVRLPTSGPRCVSPKLAARTGPNSRNHCHPKIAEKFHSGPRPSKTARPETLHRR